MPDLMFEIVSSKVKPYAVMPSLAFQLKITNKTEGEEVYAAALKCQVMIEAVKRTYNVEEKDRLHELFGEPYRWHDTLRTFFWTIINIPVPRFTGSTIIEVIIPCSEDQALAAGKYFYAVESGSVPLSFLFSGTLFYKNQNEELQVTLVPWEKEALHKMPVLLWKEMIEAFFPNTRWLKMQKDIYDKLVQYKSHTAFASLQDCFESVLDEALKERLAEKQSV